MNNFFHTSGRKWGSGNLLNETTSTRLTWRPGRLPPPGQRWPSSPGHRPRRGGSRESRSQGSLPPPPDPWWTPGRSCCLQSTSPSPFSSSWLTINWTASCFILVRYLFYLGTTNPPTSSLTTQWESSLSWSFPRYYLFGCFVLIMLIKTC